MNELNRFFKVFMKTEILNKVDFATFNRSIALIREVLYSSIAHLLLF
jgi:hypothetical protein